MKTEEIKSLFEQFEKAAAEVENIECWSARELCKLLGYSLLAELYKGNRKGKKGLRKCRTQKRQPFY